MPCNKRYLVDDRYKIIKNSLFLIVHYFALLVYCSLQDKSCNTEKHSSKS